MNAANRSSPLRVLHVVPGLTRGGAEMMLYKLAREMKASGVESTVACLGPDGGARILLEAAGIPVHRLAGEGDGGAPPALRVLRLMRLARRLRPQVVQGWMGLGNLAATAARAVVPDARLFWSVHQSLYALEHETPRNARVLRLAARLSGLPEAIVYVSRASAAHHAALGFRADKARVIPIGFDLEAFQPLSLRAKAEARARFGLDPSAPLAGLVARDDPKKDVAGFIEAAARAAPRVPDARFVLVGRGMDRPDGPRAIARARGVESRFDFRGEQEDMPAWMGALDVLVSASYTEAFPNVIGEAMACGVPCAVTDVGDSAYLLGEAGAVVPPRDPAALADALAALLGADDAERAALGAFGRARIEAEFSLEAVARRYRALYDGGAATARAAST